MKNERLEVKIKQKVNEKAQKIINTENN